MPYGSANGGGPGLPGGGQGIGLRTGSSNNKTPITSVTKSIGYTAAGGNSTQVLSINKSAGIAAVTNDDPSAVFIENTGIIPVVAMIGYESYTALAHGVVYYVHAFLQPGEAIQAPVRGIIPLADFLHLTDETVLDFTAPNTTIYTASSALLAEPQAADEPDIDIDDGSGGTAAGLFKVNDLIRIEDEIMRIDSINSETLSVTKGLFGSSSTSHNNNDPIRFPFFNEYYDYDRVLSGNTQLVQTDGNGRFKCSNFFGNGRLTTGLPQGITPGSFCMKFYSSAYMDIPMGGTGVAGGTGGSNIPIASSTSSQLSTSTEYSLNLTIDDSSATTVSFTTDTSNVNFGGTNGVISKLQDAINTSTRTAGNNLFGYSCSVGIVNSKLRFTSNSHLLPHDGTNGSKILIEDGAGGTNVLTGAAGIFPDINNSIAAVEPQLPDNEIYDPITYGTTPNVGAFAYDRGDSKIYGQATGNINYETGALDFVGPANASFQISACYNGPFSGKRDATETARANSIVAVHGNVLNRRMVGQLKVTTY